MKIQSLTSKKMAEVDRRLIDEYGIELTMMMENAGRALAVQSSRLLGESVRDKRILVMTGKGNNGGGGLVSARHLHNWGAHVEISLSSSAYELKDAPAKQLFILQKMKVPIHNKASAVNSSTFDTIIDSLLGYNQKGDPRGRVADLVMAANDSGKPVLALDVPTGLDPDRGFPYKPCIKATQTLTLAFPKAGLLKEGARAYVGKLFLADISVPRGLYLELGPEVPPFDFQGIVEII